MIHTTAADVSAMCRAVLPHVALDSTPFENLKGVRFEVEAKASSTALIAVACDRYTMGSSRALISSVSASEPFGLHTDDVRDLLSQIGAGKTTDVTFDLADDEVIVNNEFAYGLLPGVFPDWRKAIYEQLECDVKEGPMDFYVQTGLLTRFKYVSPVRLRWVHPDKAIYVTSAARSFEGLFMPLDGTIAGSLTQEEE